MVATAARGGREVPATNHKSDLFLGSPAPVVLPIHWSGTRTLKFCPTLPTGRRQGTGGLYDSPSMATHSRDATARLEITLRSWLLKRMQQASMLVVCRRNMAPWLEENIVFLFFFSLFFQVSCNATYACLTAVSSVKTVSDWGGTGDEMDAWSRFIFNVPCQQAAEEPSQFYQR